MKGSIIVVCCCILAITQAHPLANDIVAVRSIPLNGGQIPVAIEEIAELSAPVDALADAEAKRKARQIVDIEVDIINGGGGYGGGGYGGYGGYGGGYGGYGGFNGGYGNYGYSKYLQFSLSF